jgi:hypothetical protein
MKKIVLAILAACSISAAQAQDSLSTESWFKKNKVFQNLDVSVTAGTTGIGIDVASKIGDYVQLRAGYEFMPRFKKSIYFPVEVGGQPAKAYDATGNRIETRFDKLSKMLKDMTGFQVEDEIEMVGKPTINNFKFLVDVFPFKQNKHWHFTAGFYWGPSKFAEAENSTQAMSTLLAVSMYNQLYEKCVKNEPMIDIEGDGTEENPGASITLPYAYRQRIKNYGRMGFHVGDKKDTGERYEMEPDPDDDMVKVQARSNSFKPYLGFGYGGRLLKNRDDWHVSFDAGAMFWGGTPDLITHDGTNLTKDVENIGGKVGDWVDLIGGVKVFPVLSVRFTKTIF